MKSTFAKKKIVLNIALALATGVLTVGCAGNSVKPMQSSDIHQESTVAATVVTPQAETDNAETRAEEPIKVSKLDESQLEINQIDLSPDTQATDSSMQEITYPDIDISKYAQPGQLNFQFGFDKAELSDKDIDVIHAHAKFLINNPDVILNINGHTDHHGPKAYNEYLSKKRADAVAMVLIEEGVPESQIQIRALANDEPLLDIAHTRMNRRVELNYTEMNFVSAE